MKPLLLITNDDGYASKGLRTLCDIALEFGDVVVMAPEGNSSCLSHSLTPNRPLRVRTVSESERLKIYACDGTPADCTKMALENFCPTRPVLALAGINHGSNSSINVHYSGTMGAAIEASLNGLNSIGFSLLSHSADADFGGCIEPVRNIIADVLQNGLPVGIALNVNIPYIPASEIKGLKVCRAAQSNWHDSYQQRIDPVGRPYWWLTGKFVCDDLQPGSDEWALRNGYVSIVPTCTDFTHHSSIQQLSRRYE
ncbi:MAG: 5'/3'-nucleotidase SurE [Bacteroidales bacterium]|nr:5'/3'-nucleotidase SurE [Bacteroidales bacterium]